jgi:hypothetical protein
MVEQLLGTGANASEHPVFRGVFNVAAITRQTWWGMVA